MTAAGRNIADVVAPEGRVVAFFSDLQLSERENTSATASSRRSARLGFLANVGIGYLTSDAAATLGGGEAQRSGSPPDWPADGRSYILTSPSAYQRDNAC